MQGDYEGCKAILNKFQRDKTAYQAKRMRVQTSHDEMRNSLLKQHEKNIQRYERAGIERNYHSIEVKGYKS